MSVTHKGNLIQTTLLSTPLANSMKIYIFNILLIMVNFQFLPILFDGVLGFWVVWVLIIVSIP